MCGGAHVGILVIAFNSARPSLLRLLGKALDEVNPKKKILERLFPDMKTDAEGVSAEPPFFSLGRLAGCVC